jgi:Domain of unknown function (DUF4189)
MRRRRFPLALVATAVLVLAVPAVAFAEYGVIAVNQRTTKQRTAVAPSLSLAERAAKQACGARCVVMAEVNSKCAAVVHVGRRYWTGYGSTQAGALRNARRHARRPRAPLEAGVCAAPGNAPLTWGAVALNRRTGAWATGGGSTQAYAETAAKDGCGRGCRIAFSVHYECGVLVRFGSQYWIGIGPTAPAAGQNALQRGADPHARVLALTCAGVR